LDQLLLDYFKIKTVYNMAQKISDCCGAAVTNPVMLDLGICPDCKDHCEFINEEEDETT
jgi:hypothetical protein